MMMAGLLSGTIPSEIGMLSSLKSLRAHENSLSGKLQDSRHLAWEDV
jgi:hypothetical protein